MTDFSQITKQLNKKLLARVSGVEERNEAAFLVQLFQKVRKNIVLVARNHDHMEHLRDEIAWYLGKRDNIHIFPAWDVQPYDRVSADKELQAQRMEAITHLQSGAHQIILTTVNALSVKLPPLSSQTNALDIKVNEEVPREQVIQLLENFGYLRVGTVMEPGEYAVRGSIVDIYPPTADNPVRIDYFDDDVESLKIFDVATQRTESEIDTLSLKPAAETVLNDKLIATFRQKYRGLFPEGGKDPIYTNITEGRTDEMMGHYLPLFFEAPLKSFYDYLPDDTIVLTTPSFDDAVKSRSENIFEAYQSRIQLLEEGQGYNEGDVYRPIKPDDLYLKEDDYVEGVKTFYQLRLENFDDGSDDVLDVNIKPINFHDSAVDRTVIEKAVDKIKTARSNDYSVLVSALSQSAEEKIAAAFEKEKVIGWASFKKWNDIGKKASLYLGVTPLSWGYDDKENKTLVITEQDLFGERQNRPKKRKRNSADALTNFAQLTSGSHVVHNDHGIGRFEEMVTMNIDGQNHDFLKIVYDGDDKLFVPIINLDVLSRYSGGEGDNVRLDKLGGAAWQARKAKVKKDLLEMAGELIEVAAERATRKGYQFKQPDGFYDEFCTGFPYVMTPEQQSTMEEVTDDMCSPRAMDRLVVGDVGFGKTEIALRAAFLAAVSGKQVAVIAPTTLLAKQHYDQFVKRFANFPISLGHLSRLSGQTAMKQCKDGLKNGSVDIVVGTHAVLSDSVKFKDLGLLIIDEEQRFGVKHKEKLKDLKASVDVITLTATPIPRTMQMAVSGLKGLSTITTPPVDRLAVRTYVMPYDGKVMREAIVRELFRRGQSFIVTPRVDGIEKLTERFSKLVPEAKFRYAHGRMNKDELDEIMTEFYEGKFDVLVATTIIESGIDVPKANTMIVHNAHMFGLAQLYQLRGRVGRSKLRAYSYLLLPERGSLTTDAEKRLRLLQRLEGVGSGFMLASYDLDTRGAGNVLGKEQSGQIKEIGFELYNQMLQEAIRNAGAKKKGEKVLERNFTPVLNLGLSYLIPEEYITDLNTRLQLYRRLSHLETEEEVEEFREELVDRFGKIPEQLQALLEVVIVRNHCYNLNIERVEAGVKGAVITLHNGTFPRPERLFEYIQKRVGLMTVRPDQRIVLHRPLGQGLNRLKVVHKFLLELEGLLEENA